MNTTKKQLTPEEIKARLAHATGSATFYNHNSGILVYTEGVQDMAQLCDAYWLIDIAASTQTLDNVANEEFQVIKLQKHDDDSARVTVTDGRENKLYSQKIPFTDFPLDEFKLFYNNPNPVYNDKKYRKGTLYLPSEH